jgi:hypothetical protein
MYRRTLLISVLLVIAGCTPDDVTGPGDIRWDREVCARCSMAVGDRNFAAQVRGGPASEKTRLYKFDDIGCAMNWLQQQAWKDDLRTEVWVVDYFNGDWLDARNASYVKGKISPMNYGLAATAEATSDTLDFVQAKAHIMTVEHEHHRYGADSPVREE